MHNFFPFSCKCGTQKLQFFCPPPLPKPFLRPCKVQLIFDKRLRHVDRYSYKHNVHTPRVYRSICRLRLRFHVRVFAIGPLAHQSTSTHVGSCISICALTFNQHVLAHSFLGTCESCLIMKCVLMRKIPEANDKSDLMCFCNRVFRIRLINGYRSFQNTTHGIKQSHYTIGWIAVDLLIDVS